MFKYFFVISILAGLYFVLGILKMVIDIFLLIKVQKTTLNITNHLSTINILFNGLLGDSTNMTKDKKVEIIVYPLNKLSSLIYISIKKCFGWG